MDPLQTRFMLHEIAKEAASATMARTVEAVKQTGLKGRMVAGNRYWTRDEVKAIVAVIENGELEEDIEDAEIRHNIKKFGHA